MASVSCSDLNTTNCSASNSDAFEEVELPIIVSYIILIFRIVTTVYVTVIGVAVIVTVIKERKNLKGRHILLIVNLMVSAILCAMNATVQSSIMIISYIVGADDPIRCDILFVTLSTFHVNAFALLLVSFDKLVAIGTPLHYRRILTNRIAYIMIFLSWTVSLIISVIRLLIGETFKQSSQYGVCIPERDSFTSVMISFIAPVFLSCLGVLFIDIYSSVTACKPNMRLNQNCEEGFRYTGPANSNTNTRGIGRLGHVLDRITGHNTKPIMAVLIGLAGNCLLGFICPVLFVTTQTLPGRTAYRFYTENIVIPNAAYCFLVVQSAIYSMYFASIRKPMCKMMKQLVVIMCPSCVQCYSRLLARRTRVVPISRRHATAQSNAWL